ncbi:MAG: hypothetical protein VKI83_04675 [Synechococcaceae cyanobacterium]|nr:hypothetical protein [Synechococcaceae cyanobacterium]
MALSALNLGGGTYAYTDGSGTYLNPLIPDPADFSVSTKTETKGGKTTYTYDISERSAGAFTLFGIGNFLDPSLSGPPYFKGDLVENSKVNLKGNIVAAGIGLGYGDDALKVEGSASLTAISTDADPTGLVSWFMNQSWVSGTTAMTPTEGVQSMLGQLQWLMTQSPVSDGTGYADSVEIKGDANLSLIATGLGSDSVKISGGLVASVVLLDGLGGIGGGGGGAAGKDKLEVAGNSSLAAISCGANDDTVTFKSGAIAVDVNGGDNNDTINFNKGLTGNFVVSPGNVPAVDFQLLDLPLGVIAGGADNDKINIGGGSSSYGIGIFGDDPLINSTGNDEISFGKGSASLRTWLRNSLVDLGEGSDQLKFGDYTSLKDVIIDCGGTGGNIDTITFSSSKGAATFSATNVLVRDFGVEDTIVLAGVTYTGAAAIGNATLLGAGITVVAA